MDRRDALRTGLLAGVGMTTGVAAAEAGQREGASDERVAHAVFELQNAVQRQTDALFSHWRVVRQVQDQQRPFLRANHRYPQFIEVGTRIWEDLLEWHVKERQPMSVTRAADGRYTMSFQFSTIVLRPELDENHMGFPYDMDRTGRQ